MLIKKEEITISNFLNIFKKIIEIKNNAGIISIINNPKDLLDRAKLYGIQYKNGSYGWASNIWSRSAAGSLVIDKEEDLTSECKELMNTVLEQILCRPLIQVDANLGQPDSYSEMKARLYIDPQFPDIAYRWKELNFNGTFEGEPDATIFCIPHYLENPIISNTSEMLKIIRFPHYNYTIITCSSYQGECKKGFLSHWIYNVYKKGGTGEHASLKEFTVKKIDNKKKRIVMGTWGLSGSGKSTHGMYIFNEKTESIYKDKFGINVLDLVSDQVIKNDDIIGIFEDRVESPERGAWSKTEDVNETQIAMFTAGMAKRALHENTEFDENGDVSFKGKLYQYHNKLNRNARTVFYLNDTGYYDGNVNSTEPLNMAVFISQGYISDFAWLKINDMNFAAKVLADGRTIGHPSQGSKGVGEEKYESRYCLPFTIGVGCSAHVNRFHQFLVKRKETNNPIEVYQINTTGRIGAEYEWDQKKIGENEINFPKVKFIEVNGKNKPIGGESPSIEETELFLLQAARGAVKYESHPIWGNKVLMPIEVEGISKKRLLELNPFNYRSLEEMQSLLKAQVIMSKHSLDKQCFGLNKSIYDAMDF
ncbi:MAG: phosphoenolpyruvate carboxykinase (ATP) [bacterium]